jgi:D-alanine-D-alanine ligase-like ATP-grasp enzyme
MMIDDDDDNNIPTDKHIVNVTMLCYSSSVRCFEVLGYDIMIDSLLNPWLIEVNHLPR